MSRVIIPWHPDGDDIKFPAAYTVTDPDNLQSLAQGTPNMDDVPQTKLNMTDRDFLLRLAGYDNGSWTAVENPANAEAAKVARETLLAEAKRLNKIANAAG